jgi:hypothetical protein
MTSKIGLIAFLQAEGKIIIRAPAFDFDTFPKLGANIIESLGMQIKEKQQDADMHSWLIDFEGTTLMLKAEHYSESIWLEALNQVDDEEVLTYLAGIFKQGFTVSRETND